MAIVLYAHRRRAGTGFHRRPFEVAEDGRACRYNLRLLQADQFVTSEQVLLRDLPSEVSPAEGAAMCWSS